MLHNSLGAFSFGVHVIKGSFLKKSFTIESGLSKTLKAVLAFPSSSFGLSISLYKKDVLKDTSLQKGVLKDPTFQMGILFIYFQKTSFRRVLKNPIFRGKGGSFFCTFKSPFFRWGFKDIFWMSFILRGCFELSIISENMSRFL